MNGPMDVNSWETGLIIICMAREYIHGKMEENMMVTI